jgi:hypothetical protein
MLLVAHVFLTVLGDQWYFGSSLWRPPYHASRDGWHSSVTHDLAGKRTENEILWRLTNIPT